MKKEQTIPEVFDSAFVNVTLSAKKIFGKYAIMDLLKASTGDRVMSEDSAKQIKYIYPVRRHEILGVFEVSDYKVVYHDEQARIRFTLKPIYEGSTRLLESASSQLTPTNYVVKYF